MPVPRLRSASLSLLLTLAVGVVGCGGGHHPSPVRSVAGHKCSPEDYAMQCALTSPPAKLAPGASPFAYGIDFAWSCPNPVGHSFGASYLSTDRSKNWTANCVNWWQRAGAKVVMVWETAANRAAGGFAAGAWDAGQARAQAAALGNTTRPVFFAIDFDAGGPEVAGYFDGVRSMLPKARVGAYGGYRPVKYLFDTGRIGYGWQTYAWSGGLWDVRAKLEQYLNDSAVDYDRAIAADYGQSPYSTPAPPKPTPKPAVDPYHYRTLTRYELGLVLHYDGARKHPAKYKAWLRTLQGELAADAHQVWVAAHRAPPKPVSWGYRNRGVRFGAVYRRSLGKQVVK